VRWPQGEVRRSCQGTAQIKGGTPGPGRRQRCPPDEALSRQLPAMKKYEKQKMRVIVDRLAVKDSAARLTDSVEDALGLPAGWSCSILST